MNKEAILFSQFAAAAAVHSLMDEVLLTPKPGLVDQNNTGAHHDLTLELMKKSAESLTETFEEIARVSFGQSPTISLREELAFIGRKGEKRMFAATGGINTHKGAIWALGLLISAAAIGKGKYLALEILEKAGEIAILPDERYCSKVLTNGGRVSEKYGVSGARGEAEKGFPHIKHVSLPVFQKARTEGLDEEKVQLNTLLSLISHLDDTCILHRGGTEALAFAKSQADEWLINRDFNRLKMLDSEFTRRNISPGGSADLLAATIFLDKIQRENAEIRIKKDYELIY